MLPYEDQMVAEEVWPQVRDAYNRAEQVHDFVVAEFFNPELKHGNSVNRAVMTTVMGLLAKICKTHRAVELVASKGLGEDGMTLARSCYETGMLVTFILQENAETRNAETRNAMYVTHMIHQKLKMFNSWVTTPGLAQVMATDEMKALRAEMGRALEKWQGLCVGMDVKEHWSGKGSLAAAAPMLEEGLSYHLLFREMSPHAHGNDLFDHVEHQDEGPSLLNLAPSATLTVRSIELSSRFLWAIAAKIDEAWALGLTSRLERFKPDEDAETA